MSSTNFSSSLNVSSVSNRDSTEVAVIKNIIVVLLGLIINYINAALIHTFRKHQIFYQTPRYILFIHLVMNDMIQLTSSICLFVLSYVFNTIQFSLCCLLVTAALFTTLNTPLNLAVMAVECYIAVCLPLKHVHFCTVKRTYGLIGWIWFISSMSTLPDVIFVLNTESVPFFQSKLFCTPENLFKHPVLVKKTLVSYIIYMLGVWATLFFTYFKLFFTARAAKQTKTSDKNTSKARNTILLHGFQLMLCLLTYIYHYVIEFILSMFPRNFIHVIFIWYISVQILPRFISPVVYGLRDQTFRQHLKKNLAH